MKSLKLATIVVVSAVIALAVAFNGPVRAATEYTIEKTFMQAVGGIFNVTPTAETDGHPGTAQIDKYRRFEHGAQVVADSFYLTNAAAVNALATATKAADTAGRSHYLKSFQAGIWQDNTGTVSAAAGFTVAVRDGATGAGTVIWSRTFSFPVATNGTSTAFDVTFDPPLKGTANTALCVEFTSTALLHTGNTVNAQGFTR